MLQIMMSSMNPLFAGKMFRNNQHVLMQWLQGCGVCLALLMVTGGEGIGRGMWHRGLSTVPSSSRGCWLVGIGRLADAV